MPQSFEDQVKHEYFKYHYDNRETIVPADIADWWLLKFSEYKQSLKEEIEGKKAHGVDTGISTSWEANFQRALIGKYIEGNHKAIDDILKLID